MSQITTDAAEVKHQLRRVMGFWDVLLFCIATVLGPRWIAAAARNGQSSISLWILAAVLFFVPTAFVVVELSTRFPEEGGLYVWTKMAFGDFHGFVAGWTYWTYTIFYFPGLLMASAAMTSYVGGSRTAWLAEDQKFLLAGSLVLLVVAVWLNIIGLHIGKWLQNAGGVGTYVPLLMIVGVALWLWSRQGSVTHFSWAAMLPHWQWDTVNFWSQIAFAFTGLELVSALSEEVRNPQRTLPKAIFASGGLIAVIYMAGTIAILTMIPADVVDPKSGVFQAITTGSTALRVGILGVIAALLVTVGNAGGVGSTVAGISRVPFVVGIDRYLPSWFGKIHPKWKTPHISILVQAGLSAIVLILSQFKATERTAYVVLVSAAIALYFIPFIYMYAAVIKLAWSADRETNKAAVLIPGGKLGVCICGGLGLLAVIAGIFFSLIPPGEEANKILFEVKVVGGTLGTLAVGLILYYRGARQKTIAVRQ
ncbi:MAG TPA: APC family permease [Candidatus Acidoferrales bacterium]|nr:APC family permease [Candidatus Acidoferrales bacterium]